MVTQGTALRPSRSVRCDVDRAVKTSCSATSLRNRGELGTVLRTAVETLPQFNGRTDKRFKVPSAGSLSMHQVNVDMMYLCFWRECLTQADSVAYAWVDSS